MLVRTCPNCEREVPANKSKCECGVRLSSSLPLVPSLAGIERAETEAQKLAAQNEVLLRYHELETAALRKISANLGTITTVVVIFVILSALSVVVNGCSGLGF